eukprot:1859536-Amphidinium_carterae.1
MQASSTARKREAEPGESSADLRRRVDSPRQAGGSRLRPTRPLDVLSCGLPGLRGRGKFVVCFGLLFFGPQWLLNPNPVVVCQSMDTNVGRALQTLVCGDVC